MTITTYTLDLAAGLTQVLVDVTSGVTNTYLYGNGRIAQQTGSTTSYFLSDGLGSVRQLVDANGNITLLRSYQPYGTILSNAGTGTTSYGFTGEWRDNTGLSYLRARYYRPGRFIQKDPWPGDYRRPLSMNGFSYVEGNPINRVDPSGLCTSCRKDSVVFVGGTGGDGIYLRANPTIKSTIFAALPDGTSVRVLDNHPFITRTPGHLYGDRWRRVGVPSSGIPKKTGWAADKYLLDTYVSSPSPIPNPNPTPSNGTLSFYANPVAGPYNYMGGFGASQWAYDHCNDGPGDDCDYNWTRGLHNGIDFGVPEGTPVYWTAGINGTIAYKGNEWQDASPNVVVQADGYLVVFGHLSSGWDRFNKGDTVTPGTLLGYSGVSNDPHLHLGIRRFSPDAFYNPAYFFDASLRNTWLPMEYAEGEDMLSMKSFEMANVTFYGARFFWGTDCDQTGIERP